MKHVFLMHSAITYLASLSIISAEELCEEDCIFLYQGADRGFPRFVNSYYLHNERIGRMGFVNKLDDLINRITGDKYIAYVGSMNNIARIITSNSNCLSFCFLEEGTASYLSKISIERLSVEYVHMPKRIASFRDFYQLLKFYSNMLFNLYPISVLKLPIDYLNYAYIDEVKFYCTNSLTFPLSNNRIEIPMGGRFMSKLKPSYDLTNGLVWVSGKVIDDYPTERKAILAVVRDFFEEYTKSHSVPRIYVKFHQYEKQESCKALLSVFEDLSIPAVIMKDSTILEIDILHASNLTMIGDLSSLLFYNAIWGNKSISLVKKYAQSFKMSSSHYSEQILETLKGVNFWQ